MITNFYYLLTGNASYALAQWLVVVSIARFGTLEQQGAYNYALALIAPVTVLVRLNLRSVLITDSRRQFRLEDYLGARLIASVVPFAVLPIISWVSSQRDGMLSLMLAIALMKGLEGVSDLLHGQLQWQRAYPRILAGLAMRSVGMVAAFVIGMLSSAGVIGGVVLTTCVWMVATWWNDWRGVEPRPFSESSTSVSKIRAVVLKCWPLGVTMSLVTLFNYGPVYVLGEYVSREEIGRYSAASYLWLIGTFLVTALIQAVSPRFAEQYHRGLSEYLRLFTAAALVVAVVGGAACGALWLFGEQIVTAIYGPGYAGLGGVVGVMAAGVVLTTFTGLLGMNLTIARAFRIQMWMNVISVLAVLLFSLMLVPEDGSEGAALALVLALCIKLMLSVIANLYVIRGRRTSTVPA